jgi:undecaprenyl-diphosphatase
MIEQLNTAWFHLINQYAGINPFADAIAVLAAQYMPLIFIVVLIYLWIKKGTSTKNIVLYSVYAAILGLVTNYIIGLFYFHPRPFMVHVGTTLFPYPAETSFPSDHTTFMLSIALMMIYFKETRKFGIILVILGLIGGFARVFSGVHFPFDIVGSVVVAVIVSLVIYYLKDRFPHLNGHIRKI